MKKKYAPRGTEFYDPVSEVLRPIVGLDIDGTLGYYHEHFTAFASAWLGRELPAASEFRGGSFAKHLGISKPLYRKIKLAYRRGGAKRSMPVVPGASELSRDLRARGAIVVLCTTRPYLSLEGIDEDTRHWAKRQAVSHDFIIWGERKYHDLSRFGTRVVGVLEDEPALLKQAEAAGVRALKIVRPYNESVGHLGVWDLHKAARVFNLWLDKWEADNR